MAPGKSAKAKQAPKTASEAKQPQTNKPQVKKVPAKKALAKNANATAPPAKRGLVKPDRAGASQPAEQHSQTKPSPVAEADPAGSRPLTSRGARKLARDRRVEAGASHAAQQPSHTLLSADTAVKAEADTSPSRANHGEEVPKQSQAEANFSTQQPSQDPQNGATTAQPTGTTPPRSPTSMDKDKVTQSHATAPLPVMQTAQQLMQSRSDMAEEASLRREVSPGPEMRPQSGKREEEAQPPLQESTPRQIQRGSEARSSTNAAPQFVATGSPQYNPIRSSEIGQAEGNPEPEAKAGLQEAPTTAASQGEQAGVRQADGPFPEAESADVGHRSNVVVGTAYAEGHGTIERLPPRLLQVMEDIEAGRASIERLQPKIDQASYQYQNAKTRMDSLMLEFLPEVGGYDERLKMFNPDPNNAGHQEIVDNLLESHDRLASLQQQRNARDLVLSSSRQVLEDVLFDSLGHLMPERQFSDHPSVSSIAEEQRAPTPLPVTAEGTAMTKIDQASDGGSEPMQLETEEEKTRPRWMDSPWRLVYRAKDDPVFLRCRRRTAALRSRAKRRLRDAESDHDHFRESWGERKMLYEVAQRDGRDQETPTEFAWRYKRDGAALAQAFSRAGHVYSATASHAQRYGIPRSASQSSRFPSTYDTNDLSGRGFYSKEATDMEKIQKWASEVPQSPTDEYRSAISVFADPPNGEPDFGEGEPHHFATRRDAYRLDEWDRLREKRWYEMMKHGQVKWYGEYDDRSSISGDIVYPRWDGGRSDVSYRNDADAPWYGYPSESDVEANSVDFVEGYDPSCIPGSHVSCRSHGDELSDRQVEEAQVPNMEPKHKRPRLEEPDNDAALEQSPAKAASNADPQASMLQYPGAASTWDFISSTDASHKSPVSNSPGKQSNMKRKWSSYCNIL